MLQQRRDDRQQFVRDEQRAGAAVAEDSAIDIGREQGVERDRDHAGLQAAPENDREFELVEQQQRNAIFVLDFVTLEQMREAAGFLGQFAIAQRALFAARLHEGELVAVGARGVSIDEIGSCVFGDIDHCSSPRGSSRDPFRFFSKRVEGVDLDDIPEIGAATSPDPRLRKAGYRFLCYIMHFSKRYAR